MSSRAVQLVFGRHVHPVYREQLHAVPEGWRYTWTHPALSDATAPTKLVQGRSAALGRLREPAEALAFRVAGALGYVHAIRPEVQPGTALVHAAERLLWRPPVPYVVDLEHAQLFVLYQQAALRRPWTRTVLERLLLDERLRFLLPWSDAARRSVLAAVSPEAGRKLHDKLRVVFPAVRPAVERPRVRSHGPLRTLFIGTKFYEKGGVEALAAVREARRTHDVELDVVSYVPTEVAATVRPDEGIRLHQPGGTDVVRALYEQSDVLLFPSHMDTYGVVVGEAMSHGLPVLAPGHLALAEIVHDGESGLLFGAENMLYLEDTSCAFDYVLPPPASYFAQLRAPSPGYVSGIAAALAGLTEDAGLHARLADGALRSVVSGHLSMERRRAALTEVYGAATG